MSYAIVQNKMKVPIPPVRPPKKSPDADTCTQRLGGAGERGVSGGRESTRVRETQRIVRETQRIVREKDVAGTKSAASEHERGWGAVFVDVCACASVT